MPGRRIKWLKISLIAAIVLSAAVAGATYWSIQSGLSNAIETARAAHPKSDGDVAALIAYVNDPDHDLEKRNRAVWALGRLADPMALMVFERYFDGKPCDHSKRLCQYEMAKAINRCLDELPGKHNKVPDDASHYEKN
jgi:hypothetical protein